MIDEAARLRCWPDDRVCDTARCRAAACKDQAHRYRSRWISVSDMRADKEPIYRTFFEELNRLGFIEGQNLVVERYSAEGRRERHMELARDVVGTHPDVILVFGSPLTLAFKAATTVIPIVGQTGDPVALGLVPSLAHPGGNITGVASDAGWQLYEKWIELLKELVPKLSSVFFLASQPHWEGRETSVAVREGAKRTGTSLIPIPAGRCATCLQ